LDHLLISTLFRFTGALDEVGCKALPLNWRARRGWLQSITSQLEPPLLLLDGLDASFLLGSSLGHVLAAPPLLLLDGLEASTRLAAPPLLLQLAAAALRPACPPLPAPRPTLLLWAAWARRYHRLLLLLSAAAALCSIHR
jgi:hypothetical protein